VATKSLGAAFAHPCSVIGLSSGEEKMTASSTVSTATTAVAMTNSLTMS
jgi:hypothetical protein